MLAVRPDGCDRKELMTRLHDSMSERCRKLAAES